MTINFQPTELTHINKRTYHFRGNLMFIPEFFCHHTLFQQVAYGLGEIIAQRAATIPYYTPHSQHRSYRQAVMHTQPQKINNFWQCVYLPYPLPLESNINLLGSIQPCIGRLCSELSILRKLPHNNIFPSSNQLP